MTKDKEVKEIKERVEERKEQNLDDFIIPLENRDVEQDRTSMFLEGQAVFADQLLKDNTPPEIKKKFWSVTSKENALTFLDKDDIKNSALEFQDIMMTEVMTKGEFEYSFEERALMVQLGWAFFRKISRSKDGFERKKIVTQIQERTINTPDGGSAFRPKKRGFLGKIFGRG